MPMVSLSELLGQPEVSAFLRGVVARGRYANAYLLHGPAGWSHVTGWVTLSDLGGMDAVQAAIEADWDAMSEEKQAEWMADMQKTFEMPSEKNHQDRILVVTHFSAAPMGDE